MSYPDAEEATRISAQLAKMEQQRAQGTLPYDDTPFRLYRMKTGGFVRVLDQYPEPISPRMLEMVDAFVNKQGTREKDFLETKAVQEEGRDEKETVARRNDAEAIEKRTERPSDEAAEHVSVDEVNVVAASPRAEAHMEAEQAKQTQPCPSSCVDLAPPWEMGILVKDPQEVVTQCERVSDCLAKRTTVKDWPVELQLADSVKDEAYRVAEIKNELVPEPVDHAMVFDQWPLQLYERRKLWFVPRSSRRAMESKPVVYWMHNTLRVTQGNYGLEAAILLSRRVAAPLVVVCLVSTSIIYPVRHATTASDAYARYSFVELYQQFKQARVPFFGITGQEIRTHSNQEDQRCLSLKPNPLFELLDAFEPYAVVADAMIDPTSRRDLVHLARYLERNRSSCSWSFLSMDSMTCCPAYRLSMKLQDTLKPGSVLASEEQFGAEYARITQSHNDTYVFSPLPHHGSLDSLVNRRRSKVLLTVLQKLHLEEVNWEVVMAENAQSSPQMRRFSEGEGLQKLSQLLSGSDKQPAIQAELRGGGILSLLPFVRHGTLFAGYILQRINEAITSGPAATTPHERKALAMRKVMRSRAMNHLGKERDYALYLSLWSAVAAGECLEPTSVATPEPALLSTSDIIAGLMVSAPRTSSLYAGVLAIDHSK
ncbi:hypothetical protein PsorP6_018109 [Peronosclerospora sorghi]|uniref:Uncharacterized protein n=1 Tax=Peronosclerospora sorghi TaxID=230839 RepID=A0ACC0WF99_9STRA|nr:hypothetical protein PsorP6_018109 [Peronosclerospora sorghi]